MKKKCIDLLCEISNEKHIVEKEKCSRCSKLYGKHDIRFSGIQRFRKDLSLLSENSQKNILSRLLSNYCEVTFPIFFSFATCVRKKRRVCLTFLV